MVQIGDNVKFINDIGGGKVTGFIGKTMVNVENEDGFEMPVLISEIVVDNTGSSYDLSAQNNKPVPELTVVEAGPVVVHEEVEPVFIEGNDKPNYHFALVPSNENNPVDGEIQCFLINDSNFTVLYNYSHVTAGQYKSVEHGILEPNTKLQLESFGQADFADFPGFFFQLLCFTEESDRTYPAVAKNITVNPVKFYKQKSFLENDYFDNRAIVFALYEEGLEEELEKMTDKEFKKLVREKRKGGEKTNQQPERKKTKELVEIDLHIHELIDDESGLSKKELLDIQIDKLKSEMDDAIKTGVKRIVFIHGVGNGRLKMEVRQTLSTKYKKYGFQDASFKEYGYGATMVILRKGK